MGGKGVVIPKVWRSELGRVLVFFCLAAASVLLSRQFPGSIMHGKLFQLGASSVFLSLPLFWLLPAFSLLDVVYRIYNVHYEVNSRYIEARTGILSLHQRLVRIRYEDVRGVETDQSLLERALDIGMVSVGSAATDGMEIVMNGVSAPLEVQEMIQNERDRRNRRLEKGEERRVQVAS